VKLLSQQTPASIVFFDLLCEGHRDLREEPFQTRRLALESLLSRAAAPVHLTPATHQSSVASDWFRRFEGAGLDGVMAKPVSGAYEPDKRVMLKVKHERDCDCVVAGFRWHKKGERTAVGSLLLGLYDDSGALQHVGVCASFTEQKRHELVEFLAPYRQNALDAHPWKHWAEAGATGNEGPHRMPGGQSRWSHGKDLSWEPLRPELVVEVAYEHMQGDRFRHMAHGQAAARLHLCPARSDSATRAHGDFRERPLKLARPCTGRVVVRVGCFLRRPQRFRHVPQVHPDAGPG
jgi:ATP-dependent DNA ligase